MTADLIAVVLLLAVTAYACAGGTDYGAGFWDLTAGGTERGRRPRWLIDHAMAPVWEVNNVWLIFVLVIMWTGFPVLFQTVFTAMWLPLALAVVGMVLRGAGFALRKPSQRLAGRRLYGAVFASASVVTPFFLGAAVGGVASERVAPGTEASADVWAGPTSLVFGLSPSRRRRSSGRCSSPGTPAGSTHPIWSATSGGARSAVSPCSPSWPW